MKGHRKLSSSALKQMMFHSCGKFGYRWNSHNLYGTLPSAVRLYESADEVVEKSEPVRTSTDTNSRPVGQSRKTVTFNMALGT